MNELLDQIRMHLRGVLRRRWLVAGVACLVAVLGWTYVAVMPDKYVASGQIYVDTRSVLGPLLSGVTVATDVQSEVEIINRTLLSRPNLEKLARLTDRDVEATSAIEQEELIAQLRRATSIKSDRSNIFTIEFSDTDPVRAQQSVQSFIDMFVEQNLGANRQEMDTARRFIDEQIAYYQGQLIQAERQLANFKRDNLGLLPGPGGYDGRLERAQANLRDTEAELQDTIAESNALERQLQQIPKTISLQSGGVSGNSQPTGGMGQLTALKVQLADALGRYTEAHPTVIALKRRIEDLETTLAAGDSLDAAGDRNDVAVAGLGVPNPTFTELTLRLAEKKAVVESLQRRVERQTENLKDLEKKALTVPVIEAELAKLTRDYGVLQSKYEDLISRRESAKIAREQGATGEQVRFRIVEPPIVPAEPVSPNRPLLILAVLVFSIGVGTGVAVVFTLMTNTYHNLEDLREDFALATIGAVTTVVNRRKKASYVMEFVGLSLIGLVLISSCLSLLLVERQIGLGTLANSVMETGSIDPAIKLFLDNFQLPEV